MDTEGLKSLLWLVASGAIFFMMMRFGCGSHTRGHSHGGGHAGHDGHGEPGNGPSKDPVCGMVVDSRHPAVTSTYQGQVFHFCSDACREKFDREPSRYLMAVKPPAQEGHRHG